MERLLDIGGAAARTGPRRDPPAQPGPRRARCRTGRASPTRTGSRSSTTRRFPRRPRAGARAPRLRGVRARQAASAGRPGGSGSASPATSRAPGIGPYEGAQVRRRSERPGLRHHRLRRAGPGPPTTLAQIGAAELGVRLDDVTVVAGDTALFPFGMGTGGSRVAANAGPAVARTAREVRARARRSPPSSWSARRRTSASRTAGRSVAGLPSRGVQLGGSPTPPFAPRPSADRASPASTLHATSIRTP